MVVVPPPELESSLLVLPPLLPPFQSPHQIKVGVGAVGNQYRHFLTCWCRRGESAKSGRRMVATAITTAVKKIIRK
jgi:hypothetical protein